MSASPPATRTLVALLHGPDRPGLVARTAGWIFERGGNILHADQHRDLEAGIFFQRIEWSSGPGDTSPAGLDSQAESFRGFATSMGMTAGITSSTQCPRAAIFVSKADHCFHDLALRWRAGEFPGELALVISNHKDLEPVARAYGLPYHHVPVEAGGKPEAETR
jgi:formyltetrahydrofolate deformylase